MPNRKRQAVLGFYIVTVDETYQIVIDRDPTLNLYSYTVRGPAPWMADAPVYVSTGQWATESDAYVNATHYVWPKVQMTCT